MIPMMVSLLIGCQAHRHSPSTSTEQREPSLQDEQRFAKIVDYYRETFPTVAFSDVPTAHLVDGPDGKQRLHISVPVAVDAEYQHPYAPTFLAEQSTSTNGLARMIAGDLLLLRKERLFSRPSRVGYDGEVMVDCITYVVKGDRSR
jgi:hypothetical protein